ncbi:MAG: SMP-30/gluconolactonase/LRE family protein [Rubricoccaceae bacterium]|nr:SMP-30/gluconolactonase/LRE family protein [Rubricoccaceae bacterium]
MLPLTSVSVFYDGLDHPEGVAVHPDGSIWAGGEAGQLYRITPDGSSVEEVANTGGFVLGIAFSPDASWLAACDLKQQCVWRLDLDSGTLSEFARAPEDGDALSIPNYPVFDSAGTLYVSDSGAFREVNGRVLAFDGDGRGRVWHAGPFNFANGMCLSPEGDTLYVVCSWLPGVERVAIRDDGTAGAREVVALLPQTVPDGVAVDADGTLYVSCYTPCRIYRVAPGGAPEVVLDDWEAHTLGNPTNIAFGGPGFDQLFVANLGRWHLSRVEIGVQGAPLACHR